MWDVGTSVPKTSPPAKPSRGDEKIKMVQIFSHSKIKKKNRGNKKKKKNLIFLYYYTRLVYKKYFKKFYKNNILYF